MPTSAHQAVSAAAHVLLAELIRTGSLATHEVVTVTGEDWSVTITVSPASRAPRGDCERDVLSLLQATPGRMTTSAILDQLQRRSLWHGEATVKRTLAALVRRGTIRASRKSPRGYSLAA